mmetsp:Transcript_2877/g.7835  ORF Transcript_2877/g.7835 Transcript_2877/m.7835 type:complete len:491 (+) Transcript_2877:425-1897(+)|eukprot:CAMPEP_0172358358 /NCGR_PEP_ID=MMETSP1060-20121228/2669_1 /TAXON_ID=37318 /ORGANISM="Pseudo-nitzschia pungens, Strain cf. cingulata" /LENGTH=490 /DNA_ID=CAMNT_0013079525 /DNA_START=359 /DNA_END=1831 /DNA_ORIENTATION=-
MSPKSNLRPGSGRILLPANYDGSGSGSGSRNIGSPWSESDNDAATTVPWHLADNSTSFEPLVPPPAFTTIGNSNTTNSSSSSSSPDHQSFANVPSVVMVLPVLIMCLVGFFGCSGRGAGPEYHRGALIREQAERIWELERRKKKRLSTSDRERRKRVAENLCTMVVKRREQLQGKEYRCELLPEPSMRRRSPPNNNLHHVDVDDDDDEKAADRNRTILTKASMDTVDTEADDSDGDCRCCSNDANATTIRECCNTDDDDYDYDDDDDDEDVCPICLDGFHVGDRVLFRKQPLPSHDTNSGSDSDDCATGSNATSGGCNHVFHSDCLLPWLLKQRENDCPSCREPLVEEDDDDDIDDIDAEALHQRYLRRSNNERVRLHEGIPGTPDLIRGGLPGLSDSDSDSDSISELASIHAGITTTSRTGSIFRQAPRNTPPPPPPPQTRRKNNNNNNNNNNHPVDAGHRYYLVRGRIVIQAPRGSRETPLLLRANPV